MELLEMNEGDLETSFVETQPKRCGCCHKKEDNEELELIRLTQSIFNNGTILQSSAKNKL